MTFLLVEWLDAVTEIGWVDEPLELVPARCFSLGFLICSDAQKITLAQTKAEDNEPCNLITIPKGMVVSIQEIRYPL